MGGRPVHLPLPAELWSSITPVSALSNCRLLPLRTAGRRLILPLDTPLCSTREWESGSPRCVSPRTGPTLPSSPQKCYVTRLVYSPRGASQLFCAKTLSSFPFVVVSSDGRRSDAEVPVVLECNVRPHTRPDLDSLKIHVMWHRNRGGHQLFQEKVDYFPYIKMFIEAGANILKNYVSWRNYADL